MSLGADSLALVLQRTTFLVEKALHDLVPRQKYMGVTVNGEAVQPQEFSELCDSSLTVNASECPFWLSTVRCSHHLLQGMHL